MLNRRSFMISTSATALAAAASARARAQARAREVRVGFSQDAVTLDPANHRGRETETIIRNIHDGLVTRAPDMKIVPEIAESLRQVNPIIWAAVIRQNVRFHSGEVLTVEDVKHAMDRFTVDGFLGGQTSPRKGLLAGVAGTDIVDARTVHIKLREPWPILPVMLPFHQMTNRRQVQRVGDAGMATQPDGAGPFKLVEWRRGDRVVMERFAEYYGGSPEVPPAGPAQVDRVIFRVLPENASRLAALLAGEVDIINELPASAMRQVEANANTRVIKTNGTRTFFIGMNLSRPHFADVRVRKAMNHAINKRLIIDRVLQGTATPLNGVMSPDSAFFNRNLAEYRYDPDLARRLLTEAGMGGGFDCTIDCVNAFKEQVEAIAQMLQRVGIRARVQVWEGAVLNPMWQTAERRRERDMLFTSWGNATLDPSDIFTPTMRANARGNYTGYNNAEVNKLLDDGETETDAAKRRAMYMRAESIVNAEVPWIFLWLPEDLYGVSKRIEGWRPQADSRINLHRVRLAG
ncbi:MAG: ABC transporter substrate-binding protein [Alphaproteobacteria bacterium]|nr:ABC transporter substrate-binding protein [Alphaproteobacteria bacterium]